MTQPYKICPQCQTTTAVHTAVCASCGRHFRTSVPFPANQTQVFATGGGSFSPAPAVLDELSAQYKRTFHWVCLCIFLFGLTIIGLILGFVLYTRFEDIRTKVAYLGVSVTNWEQPLRDWSRKTLGFYILGFIGIPIGIFAVICLFYFVGSIVNQPPPEIKPSVSVPVSGDGLSRNEGLPAIPSREETEQSTFQFGNNPPETNPVIPSRPAVAPPVQRTRTFSTSSPGDRPAPPAYAPVIDHGPQGWRRTPDRFGGTESRPDNGDGIISSGGASVGHKPMGGGAPR